MPRRKPTETPPPAPPSTVTPPSGLRGLREQLELVQNAVKARQQVIDAHRQAFEAKTAHDREALEAREKEAKDLKVEIEHARNAVLLSALNAEVIDALAPDHSRTSCSDDKRINAERGCTRCALLNAIEQGYIDFTWSFQVES